MFQLLNKSLLPKELGTGFETNEILKGFEFGVSYMPFIGMVIILASAYRLAKFNIDIRQSENFIGLPTPANTLLIISLPLIFHYQYSPLIEYVIFNHWFLITLTIMSSFLLNAEIKLFSLKFKTWDFNSNQTRYIFLVLSLLAIIIFKFIAIPLIIVLYILVSLLMKK
jgi:CDP-diacylglycerol--serine O-phosphatidyltransferase